MVRDLLRSIEICSCVRLNPATDSFLRNEVRGNEEVVVSVFCVGRSNTRLASWNHHLKSDRLSQALNVCPFRVEVSDDNDVRIDRERLRDYPLQASLFFFSLLHVSPGEVHRDDNGVESASRHASALRGMPKSLRIAQVLQSHRPCREERVVLPICGVQERNLRKRCLYLKELIDPLLVGDFLNAQNICAKSLQLRVKPAPFTCIVLWIASDVPRHNQELARLRSWHEELAADGARKQGDNHDERKEQQAAWLNRPGFSGGCIT